MADERDRPERDHMPDDLQVKGIAIGAVSIAAAIAIALVAALFVIHVGNGGAPAPRLAAHPGKPPAVEGGIVLQADPAQDIRAFNAEKRRLLDSYGWVDPQHMIARIPIDRAMALLAGAQEAKR